MRPTVRKGDGRHMTSTPSREPGDDSELVTRLRVAVGRIARKLRQSNSGGMTVTQLSALVTIDQRESVRLGDLATIEGVAPSTLSRIVSSLEVARLVERTTDPDDRRSSWVSLTAEGRRVLAELRTERTLLLTRRVAALDQRERDALQAALPALERLATEIEADSAADKTVVTDRPASH